MAEADLDARSMHETDQLQVSWNFEDRERVFPVSAYGMKPGCLAFASTTDDTPGYAQGVIMNGVELNTVGRLLVPASARPPQSTSISAMARCAKQP